MKAARTVWTDRNPIENGIVRDGVEVAKQGFNELKATVIGLTETTENSKFTVGEIEYVIVANGTDASTVNKDQAYVTVDQATAIKAAVEATASEETAVKYNELKGNLQTALKAIENQKGTK